MTLTSPSEIDDRRQRAVDSLGVQVDQPEERFDRIARLAHHVFDVPMASITVLDKDRALFPGEYGLGTRSLARDQTLCSLTMAGKPVIIDDLTREPGFGEHPAVVDLGIRFYAGYPLLDPMGNVVGTLALYDVVPRTLEPDLLRAFEDMAAWAEQELVASSEMTAATRVQAAMLPEHPVRVDGWSISGVCLPSLAVGGDFYDYDVGNRVAHVSLGDVMGKGTGAALVGAGVRSALRGTHAAVSAGVDLGVTVTNVARSLHPDLERAESFVTLFELAIDLDDGFVRFVDAGCGLCLVVRADGRVDRLSGTDAPLGILDDDHWTEQHDQLDPGDRLLLFSDGLLDLVEDPSRWWVEIGAMVAEHGDHAGVLRAITTMARTQSVLDDVTAVAVYLRTPAA
jgi:hypothetical protein